MLAGCGGWTHPYKTEADFRQDSYECQMQAHAVAPQAPQTIQLSSGYQGPTQTTCNKMGNTIDCSSYS
jgi:hypothetical protein